MDRTVDEVNLNNVMHIRAHPVGHRKDETFLYFEVHFTSIGKGLYPSPWELRTSSVVKLLVPVNNSNPLYLSLYRRSALHGSMLLKHMLLTAMLEVLSLIPLKC